MGEWKRETRFYLGFRVNKPSSNKVALMGSRPIDTQDLHDAIVKASLLFDEIVDSAKPGSEIFATLFDGREEVRVYRKVKEIQALVLYEGAAVG